MKICIGSAPRAALAIIAFACASRAGDWPQWRCDAARTASTAEALPEDIALLWTRALPPQAPAWRDEASMHFDRAYEPIAVAGLLIVGSTVDDSVAAYDLATGEERWRVFTEGPIRVAPAAWEDTVFVASDDGFLHALRACDGERRWSFRGGPYDRRLLGNERLISMWPARGGPVVSEGIVYFAAGVWPFMGSFIHALDAETGRVVWTNDSTSFIWRDLPHAGARGFCGIAPQGYLAVLGDRLIVPDSRLRPAVFDRSSGEFLGFVETGNGPRIAAARGLGFAEGGVFDIASRRSVRFDRVSPADLVLAPDAWYAPGSAWDPESLRVRDIVLNVLGATATSPASEIRVLRARLDALPAAKGRPILRAGSKLVTAEKDGIRIGDRSIAIQGTPAGAIAADGTLVVVTEEGGLLAFGAPRGSEPLRYPAAGSAASGSAPCDERSAFGGYGLVLGLRDGALVEGLARQGDLHVVAIDPDEGKLDALRRRLHAAGLYGRRAAAIAADPETLALPPYLASLITTENSKSAGIEDPGTRSRIFEILRPYGGEARLPGLEVRRDGPLPGSAPWLGQNADAGNTRCARDDLVRAPLGVLWFGNSLSNTLILPRHGEGPVEQVAGGRLFIEGPDSVSASDVYTGRFLWTRSFPGIGRYYNITSHQRGAHAVGSNFFAVPDAVYVAHEKRVQALDPATGWMQAAFELPNGSECLFILVYGDLLIAGVDPRVEESSKLFNTPAWSEGLAALDRRTGEVRWTRRAAGVFRHYAVAAGRGKVFCIDRTEARHRRILALDATTGSLVWETIACVGEALSYAEDEDILISAGALRGSDGAVLWERPTILEDRSRADPRADWTPDPLGYGKWGPILRGGEIIAQTQRAFDIRTGIQRMASDAKGDPLPWSFPRSYGCGPIAGGLHILTFRSGAAGFFDLANDGGTGNLGGIRSGCTSNVLPADGVLNAPDYTRTCVCAYQNRSSLALVHMPDVEYWTFGAIPAPGRAGYNFGAPGDRRDANGTLWWEFPNQGSPSPDLGIRIAPAEARSFHHHSSRIRGGEGPAWIASSGMIGACEIAIALQPGTYTVRMHFADPEAIGPGERVFTVSLPGQEALRDLDVVKEAAGANRSIVRAFSGIAIESDLRIGLAPAAGSRPPILCGVEVVRDAAP